MNLENMTSEINQTKKGQSFTHMKYLEWINSYPK